MGPTICGSRGSPDGSEGRESIPPLRTIANTHARATGDNFSPGLDRIGSTQITLAMAFSMTLAPWRRSRDGSPPPVTRSLRLGVPGFPTRDELFPAHLRRGVPHLAEKGARKACCLHLARSVGASTRIVTSIPRQASVVLSAAHTCSKSVPRSRFTALYTEQDAPTSHSRW